MRSKMTRLAATLEELTALMTDPNILFWRKWLEDDIAYLRAGDFDGIGHLLSAFGGMGSINDEPWSDAIKGLLSEAYNMANDIRREVEGPTVERPTRRFQLVLQFSMEMVGIRELVPLENRLIEELKGHSDVDGHDIGSGESNIFIFTDAPDATLEKVRHLLPAGFKAAYQDPPPRGSEWTILWPIGLTTFKVS